MSICLSTTIGQKFQNGNFFLTPSRIWEILLGIFVMFFEKRRININIYLKNRKQIEGLIKLKKFNNASHLAAFYCYTNKF